MIGIATPSAQGLASATKDKPIVMGAITDPVGAKLVKDLKKPGGNITGVSDQDVYKRQVQDGSMSLFQGQIVPCKFLWILFWYRYRNKWFET